MHSFISKDNSSITNSWDIKNSDRSPNTQLSAPVKISYLKHFIHVFPRNTHIFSHVHTHSHNSHVHICAYTCTHIYTFILTHTRSRACTYIGFGAITILLRQNVHGSSWKEKMSGPRIQSQLSACRLRLGTRILTLLTQTCRELKILSMLQNFMDPSKTSQCLSLSPHASFPTSVWLQAEALIWTHTLASPSTREVQIKRHGFLMQLVPAFFEALVPWIRRCVGAADRLYSWLPPQVLCFCAST